VQPPARERERIATYFDPLPFWYPPFEDQAPDNDGFTLHAITQRPMAMYHSWGSQNAWLRQIHGSNRLFLPRALAEAEGIGDDDWVWVESRHGRRIKAQVRLSDGVNGKTLWTWNAIGKRAGAWNLAPGAPEATRGFLLNHLIDELLPEQGSGYRYACADPVTGQAAWYDLKVRIRKAEPAEAGETWPRFEPVATPPGLPPRPERSRFGAAFRPRAKADTP
jgi:anaerobic selenocysteine-containing dehydrogenase